MKKFFKFCYLKLLLLFEVSLDDKPHLLELMFSSPSADKMVLRYIKYNKLSYSTGCALITSCELKMFDLPNAPKVVAEYIKRYVACYEAQDKILDLPNAPELLNLQIKTWGCDCLAYSTVRKMLKLKQALVLAEFVKFRVSLKEEDEAKLFDMPNAPDLLYQYIKLNIMHKKNEPRLVDLPNAPEVMENYIKRYCPATQTLLKARALSNASVLKAEYKKRWPHYSCKEFE